jgi:hypothetical protein
MITCMPCYIKLDSHCTFHNDNLQYVCTIQGEFDAVIVISQLSVCNAATNLAISGAGDDNLSFSLDFPVCHEAFRQARQRTMPHVPT